MRIFLFIFAALIAAGGTGFYLYQELNADVPIEAPVIVQAPKSKQVYVPAYELAAGTIITENTLRRMPIEEGAIGDEMIVADAAGLELLTGSVALQFLPEGVPIARASLVQPGERGFLAAVLPKGKRAITMAISEVAGMSGLILPGDRVDIILTYAVEGDVIEAGRNIRASETLLTNLRVLALDQRMQSSHPLKDKEGNLIPPPIARTATLQVSPEEAEMITLAGRLGELSLVLNSVRDGGDEAEVAETEGGSGEMVERLRLRASEIAQGSGGQRDVTLDSEVTTLLQRQSARAEAENPVPPADRTSRVQVVRGSATRAMQFQTEAMADAAADAAVRAFAPDAGTPPPTE